MRNSMFIRQTNTINKDLYKLMSLQDNLNKLIKNRNIKNHRQIFEEFCNQLSKSIYRAVATPKIQKCKFCKGKLRSNSFILNCKHWVCSTNCFKKLAKNQIGDDLILYDKLKCLCQEQIKRKITIKVFGGPEKFRQLQQISFENHEPIFSCLICGEEKKMREFITLECEHRYCKDCVKGHLDTKISEGQVGIDITCPECNKPVDYHIIISILDEEMKSKYEKYLLLQLSGKRDDILVSCIGRPGVNCDYIQFVSKDRDDYTCPQCEARFCPKCKSDVHPTQTCEQNAFIKVFSDIPYIKEALENGSMALCPWCNEPIEKDPKGCKYMTCRSAKCKAKRYFCWDCKKKLLKFHEVHDCRTPEIETNKCDIF